MHSETSVDGQSVGNENTEILVTKDLTCGTTRKILGRIIEYLAYSLQTKKSKGLIFCNSTYYSFSFVFNSGLSLVYTE